MVILMEKTRAYYKDLLETKRDYKVLLKNFLFAFSGGGIVALLGQGLYDFYFFILKNDKTNAGIFMTLTVICIAAILTAFGIYDNIGQIGRCGLAIPITGFANAAVCSAMEYHKEGLILGIAANTLKLAGSVIVLGTTSAIIVGSIRYIFEVLL